MTEVRAITVRHPWAWSIAQDEQEWEGSEHQPKRTENRGAGFPAGWRGVLLIHAGQGWSQRGATDPRVAALMGGPIDRFTFERLADPSATFGAVIAVADLADVHDESGGCCTPWGESLYLKADGTTQRQVRHLALEQVRPLALPVPARGALGLWRPDPAVVVAVELQVGALG